MLQVHGANECTSSINCSTCKSDRYLTILYFDPRPSHQKDNTKGKVDLWNNKKLSYDGKQRAPTLQTAQNRTTKTHIKNTAPLVLRTAMGILCKYNFSKVVLVEVSAPHISDKIVRTYAILDDQSNQSFTTSELFYHLNVDSELLNYSIGTFPSLAELPQVCP